MNILDKVKAIKKQSVTVKGTIFLDEKQAEAYKKLAEEIGTKELIAIALSEPKSFRQALKKNKKVSVGIGAKIEMSGQDAEALKGLLDDGYSFDEILEVAFAKLNLLKSLKEIESQKGIS